jgi:hypothetical protein
MTPPSTASSAVDRAPLQIEIQYSSRYGERFTAEYGHPRA